MTVQIPVEEALLEEAREVGHHASASETIKEALAAYIRFKRMKNFLDVAAETDWEEPVKKAS